MLLKYIKSRTLWSCFAIISLNAHAGILSSEWLSLGNVLLALLAAYFHVHPRRAFGKFESMEKDIMAMKLSMKYPSSSHRK